MSDPEQGLYFSLCLSGEVKNLTTTNIRKYPLPVEMVSTMAKKGSKKYKDVLTVLLQNGAKVACNEAILVKCCQNGWKQIALTLALKYEDIKSLQDPKCVIKLLKLKNTELEGKMLSKRLEYMGKHESVMIYLCKNGDAETVRQIVSITFIDPNHNNSVFLRAAGGDEATIKALLKNTSNKEELERYLMVRRVI